MTNTATTTRTGRATLRVHGPGPLGHLDPLIAEPQLARLYARQLFSYPAVQDLGDWRAVTPVADLAASIPSIYNAGVGASYTSYVVNLRPDVRWDTTPPRPLTAADVARGLKRMGNPLRRPTTLAYFTSTILGMAEFCADYAAELGGSAPSAADFAEFQEANDIAGVRVLDEQSLVIELIRPALDLIGILALPCASPAPVEYNAFLPGSAELDEHIRATGPYRPERDPSGTRLVLTRNPGWSAESDPVRQQRPDRIEVVSTRSAVAADLVWGARTTEPAPGPLPELGWTLDPYLVFNLRRPDSRLREPVLRRAIAYAIDKSAIAAIVRELNPGAVVAPAGCVVPRGNDGHTDLDPYPTAGHRGDPELSRAMLAESGIADGPPLAVVHPDTDLGARIAASYTADLGKAGIAARLVAVDPADYPDLLADPARTDEWDIAATSRSPDWQVDNARVFLQPMCHNDAYGGTANHGGYHNAEVDALIEQALALQDEPVQAASAWQRAQAAVLADAPIVPVLFQLPTAPVRHGSRVTDARIMPTLGYTTDLSAIRLDESG